MAAALPPLALYQKHQRARRDPSAGLARTHRLGRSVATLDTDAAFPERTHPITFAVGIVTGAGTPDPTGLIFEMGSSTAGIALGISSPGVLEFAAGEVAAGDGGIDGKALVPELLAPLRALSIVVAVHPGAGKGRVWVDGRLVIRVGTSDLSSLLDGAWSDGADGAIGAAAQGTSNSRVSVATAPSEFAIGEGLSAYQGQIPPQFEDAFYPTRVVLPLVDGELDALLASGVTA